jgi:hypothetical protein
MYRNKCHVLPVPTLFFHRVSPTQKMLKASSAARHTFTAYVEFNWNSVFIDYVWQLFEPLSNKKSCKQFRRFVIPQLRIQNIFYPTQQLI